MDNNDSQFPLWEVFIQPKSGAPFEHAGSIHASGKQMALQNARDIYTRRSEGRSIWVVPADCICATSTDEEEEFFDPANDKTFRSPNYYKMPKGTKKSLSKKRMETKNALINYCIRLADNNLILAQRLAECSSRGPYLEEDLALTNISLDLFGQAETLYDYVVTLKGDRTTSDQLAFLRSERQYFNNLLVEQPNGDFAFTMMKQFLYSTFTKYLYEALSESGDECLKGFAVKALKEVKYHFRHSSEWIIRLGNGTQESKSRTQYALDELWCFTSDMFVMNEVDKELIAGGIAFSLHDIFGKWSFSVTEIFHKANLELRESNNIITGGSDGIHTEHLGHLLCEMQYLQRSYPGLQW